MKQTILTLVLLVMVSMSARSHAEQSPVVIELFTSQSCSSCPPADKYLGELAQQDNIIALSCHVTYWDHLRWKDTLSRQFCTDRQYQYSAYLGRKGVFTPQMIINGTHSAIGSERGKVKNALMETAVYPLHHIALTLNGAVLDISLPDTGTRQDATLYLVQYGADHKQVIGSGENRKKTVTYTNPVQIIRSLGKWDGRAATRRISLDNPSTGPDTGFAVLAQEGTLGPVIAAGKF